MDSSMVEPYHEALTALVARLRRKGVPCQWRAALEDDGSKHLHMHIFLLVEAFASNPDHTLNRKADGWLLTLAAKTGISVRINPPRSAIHFQSDGTRNNYATLPKSKPAKLADCIEWISYLYKMRSKPDRREIYFASRPTRAAKSIAPTESVEAP